MIKLLCDKLKCYYRIIINMIRVQSKKAYLKRYKNKYSGQRCFVIGNGPSLRIEDLERLKNEVTFGSHGIYFCYDDTDWRPTFYCAQDFKLINDRYDSIKEKCKDSVSFFGVVRNFKYPIFNKRDIEVSLINEPFLENGPRFSSNAEYGVYEGMTVTYFIIQLAVYMGFNEIYLLGVDHFYSGEEGEHFSKDDVCTNKPQTDKSTLSYINAEIFSRSNGVRIFNATRGGHLEAFERVDFDCLF